MSETKKPTAQALAMAAQELHALVDQFEERTGECAARYRAQLLDVAAWLRAESKAQMRASIRAIHIRGPETYEEKVVSAMLDAARVTIAECEEWIDAQSRPVVYVYQPTVRENGLWRLVVRVDGDELVVARNDIEDPTDEMCEFYRVDDVELQRFSLDSRKENGISNACEYLDRARKLDHPPQPGEVEVVYVD